MNEKNLNTEAIRQLLNRSSARIEPVALARLRDARTHALARYDARSTAPAFAWAGFGSHATNSHRSHFLYWVAAALLAASLLGSAAYWKNVTDHEVSDVDIAILTDDLPIEMYVD